MKVMIVAGEPSGDLHASHVVNALKAIAPNILLTGMGGDKMDEAGVCLKIHIRDSAVMGFADALAVLTKFLRKLSILKQHICQHQPDALLLIDFAEFNMPLAKFAYRHNVRVIYYIPPKAWAWRGCRAKKLAKCTDVIASIFPFETEFYRNAGASVEFVGHPLVDFANCKFNAKEARRRLILKHDTHVIGLMPGSRRSEVQRHLPIMLRAASNITETFPDSEWILPLAPGISETLINTCKKGIEGLPDINLIQDEPYTAMRAATVLLIASGTAALEATCIGTPMIIVFCTSWHNWRIIRALTPLENSGLPNLIANKRIVPELLQAELTSETLTEHTLDLLQNLDKRNEQRKALQSVYQQLGTSGAAERTAQLIVAQVELAHNPHK